MATVLAGILGLSIACAYLATQSTRGAIRRAEKILADLRATGLSAYWSDQGLELKYDMKNTDQIIIAQLSLAREPTEGGYRGATLRSNPASEAAEAWILSEDAHQGQYEVESNIGRLIKMRITLEGEDLTISSRGYRAQAKTPANYIPEGLMELIIYLTVLGGKDATFSMIVNDQALVGDKVRFFQVQIKPLDDSTATVYMPGLGGLDRSEYKLDSDGIVQEILLHSLGARYQLKEKRIYDPSEESSSTEY